MRFGGYVKIADVSAEQRSAFRIRHVQCYRNHAASEFSSHHHMRSGAVPGAAMPPAPRFQHAKNTNHFLWRVLRMKRQFLFGTMLSVALAVGVSAQAPQSGAAQSQPPSHAESAEQSESAGRPPVGADDDADRLRTGRWRRLDSRSGCGCRGEQRWFRTDRHHPKRLDCRKCGRRAVPPDPRQVHRPARRAALARAAIGSAEGTTCSSTSVSGSRSAGRFPHGRAAVAARQRAPRRPEARQVRERARAARRQSRLSA